MRVTMERIMDLVKKKSAYAANKHIQNAMMWFHRPTATHVIMNGERDTLVNDE
jgi:heterodisulfide reductase subunit C